MCMWYWDLGIVYDERGGKTLRVEDSICRPIVPCSWEVVDTSWFAMGVPLEEASSQVVNQVNFPEKLGEEKRSTSWKFQNLSLILSFFLVTGSNKILPPPALPFLPPGTL